MNKIDQQVRNKTYKFRRHLRMQGAKKGFTLKTLGAKMKMESRVLRGMLKGRLPITLRNIAAFEVALDVKLISFPDYKYSEPVNP